jgi:hypothetical protein
MIEDPEISSCSFSYLFLYLVAKNICWRKLPQQMVLGKLDIYMKKTDPRFLSLTLEKRNYSKWNEDKL